MYMYHNVLIHSFADGHLAIVNSAATNTGVHVSLSILVSSVFMPRVGLLSHMAVVVHTHNGILFSY